MKKNITILLIGITFNLLSAQNRIDISKVNVKLGKEVNYKTELPKRSSFRNDFTYLLEGENYDGIIFMEHKNGKIKQEFSVKNGKRDGSYKTFYKNGKIEWDRTYKNGWLLYFTKFYKSGNKEIVKKFVSEDKEGHEYYSIEGFYENGQLEFQWSQKDRKPHGPFEHYYKTGVLKGIGHFKNGLEHGLFELYKSNGTYSSRWIEGRKVSSTFFDKIIADDTKPNYKKTSFYD